MEGGRGAGDTEDGAHFHQKECLLYSLCLAASCSLTPDDGETPRGRRRTRQPRGSGAKAGVGRTPPAPPAAQRREAAGEGGGREGENRTDGRQRPSETSLLLPSLSTWAKTEPDSRIRNPRSPSRRRLGGSRLPAAQDAPSPNPRLTPFLARTCLVRPPPNAVHCPSQPLAESRFESEES